MTVQQLRVVGILIQVSGALVVVLGMRLLATSIGGLAAFGLGGVALVWFGGLLKGAADDESYDRDVFG